MLIKAISLKNFRNLQDVTVNLGAGSTALIGENAQGKTNFVEAIEYACLGKSTRAGKDNELISWGQGHLQLSIEFIKESVPQSVAVTIKQPGPGKTTKALEKLVWINGVEYRSLRPLAGHLVCVSFKSHDLNLLRGGPKFRREWLDSVILRVKPSYHEILGNYAKVVTQRNRLLKEISEKPRVTVQDQDQLLAWDKQLCRFGAQIIKQRLTILQELLPLASKHQRYISGSRETLAADYMFHSPTREVADDFVEQGDEMTAPTIKADQLNGANETELAFMLLEQLKARRSEEIWRRQSLIGPHRDDITLTVNDASAVAFASQGQQRSLVIALKLAELELLADHLREPPVLLLDDVLAELDLLRQGFLMSAVPDNMQTILTTTHLSGIEPRWLEKASTLCVTQGSIAPLVSPIS